MSGNSKRTKNNQAPIFIGKLYDMLQVHSPQPKDKDYEQDISWTSAGDSFTIKCISRFTENVLPVYFKHRNFASFIRQLNMYGFRKIRHNEGENVYTNKHFKQNHKHLLKNITRKIKEDKEEEQVEVYRPGRHEPSNTNVSRQIQDIRNNQSNLEELCRHFIEQNQRLLEENQNIIRRMEEDDREKERKLEQLLVFLLSQKDSKTLLGGANTNNEPMLSITNGIHADNKMSQQYPSQSPLEAIGNAMDSNSSMQKARELIQGIYGKKNRRRDNNFSIVQGQRTPANQQLSNPANIQGQQTPQQKSINMLQQQDDKSFLSINDFLNVQQDRNHFDLQSSF